MLLTLLVKMDVKYRRRKDGISKSLWQFKA
jgi:hypothetical protein